jgi:hypothetical protein
MSGMEHFFERLSPLEGSGSEAFARIGAETGMKVVGPGLAVSDREQAPLTRRAESRRG